MGTRWQKFWIHRVSPIPFTVVPTSAAAGSPSRNSGSTRSPSRNKRQMGRLCFPIRVFLMWIPSQHLAALKPLEIHSDFPHFRGGTWEGDCTPPKILLHLNALCSAFLRKMLNFVFQIPLPFLWKSHQTLDRLGGQVKNFI